MSKDINSGTMVAYLANKYSGPEHRGLWNMVVAIADERDKQGIAIATHKDHIAELEAQLGTKCTRCERPITDGCICGKCMRESNAAREDDLRAEQSRVMELEEQVKDLKETLNWIATGGNLGACDAGCAGAALTALAKHKGGG